MSCCKDFRRVFKDMLRSDKVWHNICPSARWARLTSQDKGPLVPTLHNSIFLSKSMLAHLLPTLTRHTAFFNCSTNTSNQKYDGLEGNEQFHFGNWNEYPSLFLSQQHPANRSHDDLFHIPVGTSSPFVTAFCWSLRRHALSYAIGKLSHLSPNKSVVPWESSRNTVHPGYQKPAADS